MYLNFNTHENLKEIVSLRVLYPFSERIQARVFELTTPEVKAGTEPLQGICAVSLLEVTQFLPSSRSTPYALVRLEITLKISSTDWRKNTA